MPKSLCAFGGLDAVTHATEAYVSVLATSSPDGQGSTPETRETALKKTCRRLTTKGSKNPVARERVHSAATIAGIAFALTPSSVYVTPWRRTNWALSSTFRTDGGTPC